MLFVAERALASPLETLVWDPTAKLLFAKADYLAITSVPQGAVRLYLPIHQLAPVAHAAADRGTYYHPGAHACARLD